MTAWHILRVAPQAELRVAEAIREGRFDPARLGSHAPRLPASVKIGDIVAWTSPERRQGRVEAYAPTFQKIGFRLGRKVLRVRPLFPGYVFVRFAVGVAWHWLLAVDGVLGLLLVDGQRPALIRDAPRDDDDHNCMAAIRLLAGDQTGKAMRPFEPGERVMIDAGLWFGHKGDLKALDERGRATVELQLFGQATPVVLSAGDLVRV